MTQATQAASLKRKERTFALGLFAVMAVVFTVIFRMVLDSSAMAVPIGIAVSGVVFSGSLRKAWRKDA